MSWGGGFPVGGMAESALFSWRNPEWPENLERNAESRVSGIWTIFEAESGIQGFERNLVGHIFQRGNRK